MRSLFLIFILVLQAGCASHQFVTLHQKPEGAWWTRLSIHPTSEHLRGIPARQLDRSWCKFSEYRSELFQLNEEIRQDLAGEYKDQASFSVAGPTLKGAPTEFVLGAYATCSGATGTAIVLLSNAPGVSSKALLVYPITNNAEWATIHKTGENMLEIWWCFSCDFISTLEFDSRTLTLKPAEFKLKEEE